MTASYRKHPAVNAIMFGLNEGAVPDVCIVYGIRHNGIT